MISFRIQKQAHGFALLSVIWISAILSLLSITALQIYLRNTNQSALELKKIQAQLMHDAAINFAVIDLLEPRKEVVANATPNTRLNYSHPNAQIKIHIQNEAGLVDLKLADKKFIQKLLAANQIDSNLAETVIDRLNSFSTSEEQQTFRQLKQKLRNQPEVFTAFKKFGSLYNGQATINPRLASQDVLSFVPKLSVAEKNRLLRELENNQQRRLFSSPVNNPYLDDHVSSFYRITTSFRLGDFNSNRTDIIKITPQHPHLYQRIARL